MTITKADIVALADKLKRRNLPRFIPMEQWVYMPPILPVLLCPAPPLNAANAAANYTAPDHAHAGEQGNDTTSNEATATIEDTPGDGERHEPHT